MARRIQTRAALTEEQGYYTKDRENKNLDVTVIEASEILEDGSVILGASIGATPELVQMADKVCIPGCTQI